MSARGGRIHGFLGPEVDLAAAPSGGCPGGGHALRPRRPAGHSRPTCRAPSGLAAHNGRLELHRDTTILVVTVCDSG